MVMYICMWLKGLCICLKCLEVFVGEWLVRREFAYGSMR